MSLRALRGKKEAIADEQKTNKRKAWDALRKGSLREGAPDGVG